jgi:hypothetical protein
VADRPSVTLKVNVAGAGAAAAQLDEIAKAQANVADATADAAKAAAAQGDAGAAAQGKLSKLWAGLKEGAGAAAGAAAGLAGMAVTLKGQLSPETQTAVAGLQGLSGVLAAFGPVGALASVAVSGVAAALAAFDGAAEEAYEPTRTLSEEFRALGGNASFLAKAMGPAIVELQRFAAERERLAKTRDASVGIFGVPIEQVPEQWGAAAQAMQGAVDETSKALAVAQAKIDAFVANREKTDQNFYNRRLKELYEVSAKRRRAVAEAKDGLRQVVDALKAQSAPLGPELPPGGLQASRGGGARAADDSIAQSVAFFTRQAEMAQANLVGAFTAAAAVAEQDAARVAEASAAAATQYSAQVAQAIAAGASAQQDAIRGIEQDAARLIGIYGDLTTGVADFGKAAGEGFAAAAVSAAIYGGSLKDAANQALQAATVTAATEALIATAKGFGYLAAGAFGYAPGLAAAKASFAAAATWGVIAGGAAAGAAATGGFGGGGAGGAGPGSLGPGGSPSALDRPAAAEAPQDREFNINFAAGAGGRPLSRGDARAVATALIDIFATGGLRLEASRA